MRQLSVKKITKAIKEMAIETNCSLTEDVRDRIFEAEKSEPFPVAKNILGKIHENILIAEENKMPLCQDTGMACVFLEIGQDVHFTGGSLEDAINEGVRQGYEEGYLRKSVVKDPLRRENTGDNTPASITFKLVEGDKVRIVFAPKGFGSENIEKRMKQSNLFDYF